MSTRQKAIVIGSGFGGLSGALRLLAMGYEVDLLERLPDLGGRARVFERDGIRYDAGPTVLTAPDLFRELFALFDENLDEHVDLLPVSPWYRMLFWDGTHFDYGSSRDEVRAKVAAFSPQDAEGYDKLLAHAEALFEVGFERYGAQPFHRLSTFLGAGPHLGKLRADRSVRDLVAKYVKDERLRRAFSVHPLLVGGDPHDTTSVYSLIHHLELKWGVWFPRGGTGALVQALADLFERHGGRIHLNADVERLETEGHAVKAAQLSDGRRFDGDVFAANTDPVTLYSELLDRPQKRRWTDKRMEKLSYSMGLFVLYFAAEGRWEDVQHHTIIFGERYRELLQDIYKRRTLPTEDLSVYLHRPAATDPSMAPEGKDAFYVLVPTPDLRADVDWEEAGPQLADVTLDLLEKRCLPGLRRRLIHQFHIAPPYFRDSLRSPHGVGFSIAPKLTQSAWFRFHNKSEEAENLYLIGAGSHPGAGLPGVVTSAKVMEAVLREDRAGAGDRAAA